nr:G protein-coupled receptor [Proales similis]
MMEIHGLQTGLIDIEATMLLAYLMAVMVISLFLNAFSLYFSRKIKRKISADHIKAQIFAINLVFTFVAIPFFICRELKLFRNRQILCRAWFALTDFIMFTYNNLLIFMAIDRYVFICLRQSLNIKKWSFVLYIVSLITGLPSLVRIFAPGCTSLVNLAEFEFRPNETILNNFYSNSLLIYNLYIATVVLINWTITIILYVKIVVYVYKCSFNIGLYKTRRECAQGANSSDPSLQSLKATSNLNSYLQFRKSKHWKLTTTFIQLLVIFSIMRAPWALVNFSAVAYNPFVFYSFCLEIIITPFIHFANNIPCRLGHFRAEKSLKLSISIG